MGDHRKYRKHRERHEQRRTVRSHASLKPQPAASYLETLAEALRSGGVTIRSGVQLVTLRVGKTIELELEAGEEGPDSAVHVTLRWDTPVPEEQLDITSGVSTALASAAMSGPTGAIDGDTEATDNG